MIILARIVNGSIQEHRPGLQEEIVYSESDGVTIAPMPNWAVELREANIAAKKAVKILRWDYNKREFKIIDLGSFVA
jgi:hypothetical protein